MAQLLSHAHTLVVVNGHAFSMFANEQPPVEFAEDEDITEVETSADGGLYGLTHARFGGTLTIKLAPTSPSVDWCITQREEWLADMSVRRPNKDYKGIVKYSAQGTGWLLEHGVLIRPMAMFYPGQTFEFSIKFQKVARTSIGKFTPPEGTFQRGPQPLTSTPRNFLAP